MFLLNVFSENIWRREMRQYFDSDTEYDVFAEFMKSHPKLEGEVLLTIQYLAPFADLVS